jgi:ABC-type transport system involved in cytochrome c biogenesis permease subunit
MAIVTILALLLTLALGIACGVFYLQRQRRAALVRAHLVAALAAMALVLLLVLTAPAASSGPPRILPPLLLAVALAAGWGAFRYLRRGGGLVLALHVFAGVASFLVFLAWVRAT